MDNIKKYQEILEKLSYLRESFVDGQLNINDLEKELIATSKSLNKIKNLGLGGYATLISLYFPNLFMPIKGKDASIKTAIITDYSRKILANVFKTNLNKKLKIPENFSQYLQFMKDIRSIKPIEASIRRLDLGYLQLGFYFAIAYYLKLTNSYELLCLCNEETPSNSQIHYRIETLLKSYGQIILYGPPGTGKTYHALDFVKNKTGENGGRYDIITFHPSYSYEEFIEGFRPITDENGDKRGGSKGGQIKYVVEDGIFKRLAIKAMRDLFLYLISKRLDNRQEINGEENEDDVIWKELRNMLETDNYVSYSEAVYRILANRDYHETLKNIYREKERELPEEKKYYLIIDEINRGDLARIFGELITCLEMDKRLFGDNYIPVTLPYSKKKFAVPPNLYIIGTMNTADKSIALVDYALRRRFAFFEMPPDLNVLEEEAKRNGNENIGKTLKDILQFLNEKIEKHLDRDHRIGHSYFLKIIKNSKNEEDALTKFKEIWIYRIMPLLQEYFYNRLDDLAEVLGGLSSKFLHGDGEDGPYYLKDPYEWQKEIDKINDLKEFLTKLKADTKSEASNEEEANEES